MSFSVAYTAPAGAHAPTLYRQSHTCPQGFANSPQELEARSFLCKGSGLQEGIQALLRVSPHVGAKNNDDLVAARGLRRKDDVAGTDAEGRGDLLGRLRIRGFRVENG